MSTTTTTAAAAATATCHQELYNIPTHDAACAMPKNSTYASLMKSCCGSASVTSYSDCDYYCLAQDQNVGDLAECLIKGSAAGEVWCNSAANATATGTSTSNATSSASGSASETGSANGTSTNDSTDPTGTSGAESLKIVSGKAVIMLAVLALGSVATAFA
ncbi:uncharacterized protein BDV14DRAFT_204632 [Aspergillus stella-maris]|uniref:uncharacterized protein n=1 Tax=Aspergillus stella-maris TaxID=1810926 RepID=UPI003CCCE7D3